MEEFLARSKQVKVLTLEEARTLGHEIRPWREARTGQWALSDDGYCFYVYADWKGRTGQILELGFSRCYSDSKGFDWGKIKARRVEKRSWEESAARTTRVKFLVKAYVQMYLSGRIDWEALGKMYRADQLIPAATVKRLFRVRKVQEMVETELRKVLRSKGISEETVVDTIKRAIDIAEVKKDVSNMLRGAEDFRDMLGMNPDKKVDEETREFVFTDEMGKLVARETKRLTEPPSEQTRVVEEVKS